MSATHAAPEWQSDPVIATICAELARRGIRPAALPRLLGNSQAYWGRRMIGDTELSVSDLRLLADLLQVPVAALFADDEKAPRPEPRSLSAARLEGLEPPTFWSVVHTPEGDVVELPWGDLAGVPEVEHLAQVYAFPMPAVR